MEQKANTRSRAAGGGAYPAWRLLVILMAMNVVAYLDRSILSLAAPAVQKDLGLGHVEMSVLLGFGFILFYVILGVPLGWLVDRASRRWIINLGILAWSVAASAAGLARGFWTMLLARLGVGAGEATLHPAAYSLIADAVPERRLGLALTLYGGSSGLGAAVSAAVGGAILAAASAHGSFQLALLGAMQPWQVTLLLSGVPGLVLAFAIFLVPEPERRGVLEDPGHGDPGFWVFLMQRWRFYVPAILGFSILQITAYGFASWHPTWMVQHFGWNIADVGLAISIGMIGAFVGSLACGWAVDRLVAAGIGTAPLIWCAGACLFSGLLIGAAFLVDDGWTCVALIVIGQLPISMIGIIAMALQQVTPNQYRGRVSAIYLLFGNLIGFGLGPLLPAALADYAFGDDASLGLSVAITAFVTAPLASILLLLGRGAMRAGLAEAVRWNDTAASGA